MGSSMSKKLSSMEKAIGAPKRISLHLLEEITEGFANHRKLGGGACGNVYLGEHKDGEKIAVKVFKDLLDLDDEQFKKEYQNLASLHHKNIVRLIGYCHETKRECLHLDGKVVLADITKKALCFEYMRNGSLDNFIFDESNGDNWRTRYAIIKGMCEGLEYLHEKLESPMYHLDLKPANVLLDENMTPKIADFGLSGVFLRERTRVTGSAIGTHGYLPPEYVDSNVVSIKFDIFSLGVVIIKIMAGKDGYFRSAEMSSQEFVELVHTNWMNRLQGTSGHTYSIQVRRCIEIALSCVQSDRHKRPSIGVIVNLVNKPDYSIILDELRNGLVPSIHQICPCICDDSKIVDILKNKLISYPLCLKDNRGMVHRATITTVGDSAGGMSTFQPVRPRIKIIDCTEGLGGLVKIDVHSKEPWILVTHRDDNVSIWNHENQTRLMAFHSISGQGVYIGPAKFIETVHCFVVGDNLGYIHVYSYVKVHKVHKFRAHKNTVISLVVHPSEPLLLSASSDEPIKLWNWEVGWQCIRTFEGHSGFVYQVKFNPQTAGNTFASTSNDSTIKIWNIHSPTPVATLDCECQSRLDYFTPCDAKRYLVTCSWLGNAQIWDLQTKTSIKQINGLQPNDCNIAVVEDRQGRPILLTVSKDNAVAFCDSNTHRYENRVNFKMGMVCDFAYINRIKSVAIGCREGIAIMEIGPTSSEGDCSGF